MPGKVAELGDLYNVAPEATLERDAKTTFRRMVCVAERPQDVYVWTAMARTTSAPDETIDLPSSEQTEFGLTAPGWWSYRFIRSVKKRWTGDPSLCAYLATLPEPMKSQVLAHYRGRPKPGR